MSTLLSLVLGFLGFFLFSFILWKRLREDYPGEDIFSFTLGLFLGGISSYWAASKVIPVLSFWFALLGALIVGVVLMRRYTFRFFEVVDALAPAWFWLALFIFRNEISGAALFSLLAFKFLEKRYRRFSWYPSGRIGFAGIASLALFSLLYGLLAILPLSVLSLARDLPGGLISAILTLSLAGVLFFRSGNEKAEKTIEAIKTRVHVFIKK